VSFETRKKATGSRQDIKDEKNRCAEYKTAWEERIEDIVT